MFNSKLTKKHYKIYDTLPPNCIFNFIDILPSHLRQAYIDEFQKRNLPDNMKSSGMDLYHIAADVFERAIFTGAIIDIDSYHQFLLDIAALIPYTPPITDQMLVSEHRE
jgi:hypothetical protein